MQNIEVITYNVGQGLFNLVCAVKDDGSPYFGVFDCGNFQEYRNRIDDAVNVLNSDPAFVNFDDVVISHQDIDHWRMFLDFLLKLNGYAKNKTSWYRLDTKLYFNWISDNAHQRLNITSVTAEHNIYIFEKNFNATASGKVHKNSIASWTINVSQITRLFSITIRPVFGYDDSFLISFLSTNSELEKPDPITSSSEDIHNEVINIISLGFKDWDAEIINEIYAIINIVFWDLHLNYEEYEEMINTETENVIVKGRINCLHLGGQMRGNTYSSFCSVIGLFASMIYHSFAFTQMIPDDGQNATTHSVINYEFEIKGHTGTDDFEAANIYKNATSQITSLVISDSEFILFPGDATVHTFTSIVKRLQQHPYDDLVLFVAPHHGSYHTNFAFEILADKSIDFSDNQPLVNLFTGFPPQNIYISANHKKFGHPSAAFVTKCRSFCRNLSYEHRILCCDNNERIHNSYYSLLSVKSVFTTENTGDLVFSCPSNYLLNNSIRIGNEQQRPTVRLPDNDFFIPFGGFNL